MNGKRYVTAQFACQLSLSVDLVIETVEQLDYSE